MSYVCGWFFLGGEGGKGLSSERCVCDVSPVKEDLKKR